MTKYIFITGGVVSSLGKGIIASSIGKLLKIINKKILNKITAIILTNKKTHGIIALTIMLLLTLM